MDLDAIVTGAAIEPGDAIVGIPSSGIHSNGLSLARRVLPDLDEAVGDTTVGELLLEPTVIYVRAVRELLESEVEVRGLAHITGEGFLNLLRLEAEVGYRIDAPLPVPRDLRADRRARRRSSRPSSTRSSTWAAASAAWCRPADAERRRRAAGRPPPRHRGDRPRHRRTPASWS